MARDLGGVSIQGLGFTGLPRISPKGGGVKFLNTPKGERAERAASFVSGVLVESFVVFLLRRRRP